MKNTLDNQERPAACPGPHQFVRVPGARLRETYRCVVCIGLADRLFVEGYVDGLRDGRALERGEFFNTCVDDGAPPP